MTRRKYVKAMLKAIDLARRPVWDFDKKQSKTNGLRVIKRFERVNKTTFDPFNKDHLFLIKCHAVDEVFFRHMGKVFKKINRQGCAL